MSDYRKIYNKAKGIIAKKYNAELHAEMVKLGYKKAEKKVTNPKKVEVKKVTNPKKVEVKKVQPVKTF